MIEERFPQNRQVLLRLAEGDYAPELVQIDEQALKAVKWPSDMATSPMIVKLPIAIANDRIPAISFLLAMTSINYGFWRLQPDGALDRYQQNGQSGARALWAAFEAIWLQSATPVEHLAARLRAGDFPKLFENIPDEQGRLQILAELLAPGELVAAAKILANEIDVGRVSVTQAAALATRFPLAFDDPYLKKAQLALAMIAATFREIAFEVDVSGLTAFADYQVPRVLRALGILRYAEPLAAKVDGHQLLAEDGVEERAIRAATLLACEAIASHTGGTAADIDNLLWLSQGVAGAARFHLTATRRY